MTFGQFNGSGDGQRYVAMLVRAMERGSYFDLLVQHFYGIDVAGIDRRHIRRGAYSAHIQRDGDFAHGRGAATETFAQALHDGSLGIEGPLRAMLDHAANPLRKRHACFAQGRWQVACFQMRMGIYQPRQQRGIAQVGALIPGVSRSGATISAGLFRNLDRVTATRLSFFLGIPALAAAGLLEGVQRAGEISQTVGWVPTVIGTAISFVVAYASIAWLLRFVQSHSIATFVYYRAALGGIIVALLWGGVVAAT